MPLGARDWQETIIFSDSVAMAGSISKKRVAEQATINVGGSADTRHTG